MESGMLSEALEQEHRAIDAGLSGFVTALQKGEQGPQSLENAVAALRRHIYLEEEFLFPVLRRGRFVAAVMVMLREHGEIWRTLDELEAGVASAMPYGEVSDIHDRMAGILAEHNEKEEAILYPAADDALDASEQARLKAFLQSGTMPGDWVCQAVRASPSAPGDRA